MRPPSLERGQARGELFQDLPLLGEALAIARDDLGRGALDEVRAPELALENKRTVRCWLAASGVGSSNVRVRDGAV